MYCTKCGKQIPDDSRFCPECGANCNGDTKDTKNTKTINVSAPEIDVKQHKSYVLSALKHPVTTMKDGLPGLSLKVSLIYGIIITLIIPLIKVLSMKAFSYNVMKSITNLITSISGESFGNNNSMIFKQQFNAVLDAVFPTGSIYFLNLLNYILLYGIIVLIVYLVYKFLIKEDISLKNLGNIFFVFSIINLIVTIIASLFLIVGVVAWAIISIFGSMISIILIFSGFNSIVEGKNKLVYLFSFAYVVSFGIVMWFSVNDVTSIVTKIIYNSQGIKF